MLLTRSMILDTSSFPPNFSFFLSFIFSPELFFGKQPDPEDDVGSAYAALEPAAEASEDDVFSFPDSDDSRPAWRQKVQEIWKEQDDMLQTLCEGSEVVERNDHYFPADSDSPDTKRSKLKQIWKDQDRIC